MFVCMRSCEAKKYEYFYFRPSLIFIPINIPIEIPTKNKNKGPGLCFESNTPVIPRAGAMPNNIFLFMTKYLLVDFFIILLIK